MESATLDRILLVDDNPTNLQVLYQALADQGYELLIAQSGEEALDVARNARPQLILLDINMPGMDGFETCRQLKADEETRDAVVIFLSARGDVADKVQGLDVGAVDYISKPFQFEEVVARVRTHLETYHQHQALKDENQKLASQTEQVAQTLTEEHIVPLIEKGESETVEFKATLRWNLMAGKPGKEIENACLKTIVAFLNSNGGFLLIGVQDDGSLLDIETDRLQNEDRYLLHFNNLVKNHIGFEFAHCINPSLVTVRGTRILAVECQPSAKAVFLKRDKEELFFVRVGPASQVLSPSKLLAYLENRTSV